MSALDVHVAAVSCLGIIRWARIALLARENPAVQGEALGIVFAFAHDLVDSGASPSIVRSLITEAATL